MERLLPALEGLEPAYLVGGAVRDLLRGAVPNDIDIAVEGDARSVARAVAKRLGSDAREYERFGTATVETPATSYNFATTREEAYDSPGELPRVAPAPLADDLRRRDFSINAMAVGLTGDDLGHLYDPTGGLADMEARLVRVLHERSFLDDPTRLLRAVRYAVRLGFALDPETERLAREATAGDALSTVSGARIRDELMDLLGELDAPAAIKRMRDLEIHTRAAPRARPGSRSGGVGLPGRRCDRGRPAHRGARRPDRGGAEKLDLWLGDLHLPAEERDAAARAARVAPRIATTLREREHSPSELRALLGREPPEALALALALSAPSEPILRWASELRPMALEISGADLLAAGVPEGPAVGRALDETLNRKLDGLVSGRDEELETALLLAREHAQ